MSAAVTFFISFVLIIAFLLLRVWEERRGRRVFGEVRRDADLIAKDMYEAAVLGSIPSHFRVALIKFLHMLGHDFVLLLVEGLRALERPLTRFSYRLRTFTPQAKGKDVSPLLKAITPEKKENGNDTGATNGTTPESKV